MLYPYLAAAVRCDKAAMQDCDGLNYVYIEYFLKKRESSIRALLSTFHCFRFVYMMNVPPPLSFCLQNTNIKSDILRHGLEVTEPDIEEIGAKYD